MPELPDAKRARFVANYGLSAYDAEQLTAERPLADYFENTLKIGQPYADSTTMQTRAKAVANWTLGDLRALLNADARDITASPITPQGLADLLTQIERGAISGKQAKDALGKAYASGEQPGAIITREGVSQISDTSELDGIVAEVIAANPKPVEDYRAGKTSALQFLVGQVMKRTKGRAKPDAVMPIIERQLSGAAGA
jgi:aspartyl-tRNA(Asn)/glutamyl-tRNA(Gln) amidotransferase subunit B